MTHDPRFGHEHGVVLPVRVDPTGTIGPRKREAAGPEWRRTSQGGYVRVYVEQTPVQRVGEAGWLLPRKNACITGWGALAWQDGWWFSGTRGDAASYLPVPVATARHSIRPQPCIALCEERWDPTEVIVVDGLPVAQAVRAACFAARYAPSREAAVVVLDLAAFHDLASLDEVAEWLQMHPSYTGIEQARQAFLLADENAWSPTEPPMRLEWVAAGFPLPLTNRPLFDLGGRHAGTPDLIDPVNGVVGEYNGALHLEGSRRYADLTREENYRSLGLEPVVMVAGDLPRRWEFRQRLAAAYRRASARPVADRLWTMERPPWWPATFTVEQRRSLSETQRERWLKHQRAS